VLDFHHPHQLKAGLEGLNMELPDQPETLEQLLVDCRDTLKYGVRTGHPRFFNQLSSGLDVVGLVGEWLTSTANSNMFTYEVSPVFILMEEVLLKKMQSIVGWSDEWGDGLFCPDRHRSNLQGIERSCSITWNPHKMMGVPLQCSAILVKKRGLLQECNEMGAEYFSRKTSIMM
ncbi:unnamed protein product, partial [Tetraodon nigroviridis]